MDEDSTKPDKQFADRFRDAFEQTGKSMAVVARESGVPYDVVNKLVRGDNKTTSSDNAMALARVVGPSILGSGKQPTKDVLSMLGEREEPSNKAEGFAVNEIRVAVVGGLVQVSGTYDKDGVAKLVRFLSNVAETLD